MTISFKNGEAAFDSRAVRRLAQDLTERLDGDRSLGGPDVVLDLSEGDVGASTFWPFARKAYEARLLDLIAANGLPSVNYDLYADIQLERPPLGLAADFSKLVLERRPTKIAGFEIDFPLGVPASILTANASFLRYYAERGYSILTYKTVRSRHWPGHPMPQWVFLEDPQSIVPGDKGVLQDEPQFLGRTRYFPGDPSCAGMANSFGVPSHAPSWWQGDMRAAREFARPGHQVLIASVMSSVLDAEIGAIIEDFVTTALLVKECEVDIIELNFSCPNTRERVGEIYKYPPDAEAIARAVRKAVGATPIFVKIGYLDDVNLADLFQRLAPLVDGIVAINTMSARVTVAPQTLGAEGKNVFPDRKVAGVSGWPVQRAAQRMAVQLARLRDEFARCESRKLTLLGLGGVMSREDFDDRLKTGVDAVQVCTGAYLNPLLGFEIRNAQGKVEFKQKDDESEKGREPNGTGAHDRSDYGKVQSAPERGIEMDRRAPAAVLDPVTALTDIKEYLSASSYEQRRRDFASWEPKLLSDMDTARNP